jgi:mannitol/fructose-specific phosphotransferase system IIA component (Ntr-type)
MNWDDLFGPNPGVFNLEAKDRWEAIDELIGHLVVVQKIRAEQKEGIIAAVRKRESSMTTGIGFGIGMPHATTDLVSEKVWALGWSKAGIQFDALDRGLVQIVILFLMPSGQFQRHSSTLADFAKLVNSAEFRDELRRRFEG